MSLTTEEGMATTYYRVAANNKNVVETIPVDDATKQIAGKEAYVPSPQVIEEANLHVSAARRIFDKDAVAAGEGDAAAIPKFQTTSWRVSDEEFVIKIDASPLHMSAAQRMFDQQKNQKEKVQQQQQPDAIQEEEGEGEPEPEGESKHENEFKKFWGKMLKIYSVGGGSSK
mmetsp:Transcript_18035/g.43679  ORF Transcript_18035/g.43679 Transcript_18035/m.43679 type:complete len:171 (+) Transcript_18035:53-565(+)